MSSDRRLRATAIALVVALLAIGGLVDRSATSAPTAQASTVAQAVPTVAGPSALSSSWYCAGGTSGAGSQAAGTVIASNLGSSTVNGRITAVSRTGGHASRAFVLAPYQQALFPQSSLLPSDYVADTVQLDGGEVVVAQQVSGPQGVSEAPCASATSSRWYFGSGSTTQGNSLMLSLYNPGSTDAIADLSFATDHGVSAPGDYQGLLVPAGQLVVVDVGLRVQDDQQIATTVDTRIGRLVADQLSVRTAGQQSLTLLLGASSLAKEWTFPFAVTQPGVGEELAVFNPSAQQTARVQIGLALSSGEAEPLKLVVPPQSRTTVTAASLARISPGVGYSATVSVTNQLPVLAQRITTYGSPASYSGRAETMGAPGVSGTWVFPPALGAAAEGLGLRAFGRSPVRVSVTAVTASGQSPVPAAAVTLEPDRPLAVSLPSATVAANPALVVRASGPVVVERDQDHSSGVSAMIGIPPG